MKTLNELIDAQGWMPIEEAPKDGTRILATRTPFDGRPPLRIVWWGKTRPMRHEGWKITVAKLCRWEPTHWLPLPEPPEVDHVCIRSLKGW